MNFRIEIAESALTDLAWFKKFERATILDALDRQLLHEPMVETRNRKKLRETALSRWELRVGRFRIFYHIDEVGKSVDITAVGYKKHNHLYIRGKEVKL